MEPSYEYFQEMMNRYGDERKTDYFTLKDQSYSVHINMTDPARFDEQGNYVTAYNCSYSNVFSFERDFDSYYYVNLVGTYRWMAKYFMVAYLGGIYLLRQYMKDRPRYNLKLPLFLWNVCLAGLSCWGAVRSIHELGSIISDYGLTFSFCFAGKP